MVDSDIEVAGVESRGAGVAEVLGSRRGRKSESEVKWNASFTRYILAVNAHPTVIVVAAACLVIVV
jgi:hypothetical protein